MLAASLVVAVTSGSRGLRGLWSKVVVIVGLIAMEVQIVVGD